MLNSECTVTVTQAPSLLMLVTIFINLLENGYTLPGLHRYLDVAGLAKVRWPLTPRPTGPYEGLPDGT